MQKYTLDNEQAKKFAWNIVLFTAPALAVFFGQLAMGVELKIALGIALVAFWGVVADYFKKLQDK